MLFPVFVPVKVRVRVPVVSNRLMLAPVWVKLRVAAGTLPEASIVPPVAPFRTRISRFVLWGVEPVYCSVPPRKCRPIPVPLVVLLGLLAAPMLLATP